MRGAIGHHLIAIPHEFTAEWTGVDDAVAKGAIQEIPCASEVLSWI
jgi:hypothetical protein